MADLAHRAERIRCSQCCDGVSSTLQPEDFVSRVRNFLPAKIVSNGIYNYPQLLSCTSSTYGPGRGVIVHLWVCSTYGVERVVDVAALTAPTHCPQRMLAHPPLSPQASRLSLVTAPPAVYGSRAMDELGTLMPCFFHSGPFAIASRQRMATPCSTGSQRPGQLYIGLKACSRGKSFPCCLACTKPTPSSKPPARAGRTAPARQPALARWTGIICWITSGSVLPPASGCPTGYPTADWQRCAAAATQPSWLNQDNTPMPLWPVLAGGSHRPARRPQPHHTAGYPGCAFGYPGADRPGPNGRRPATGQQPARLCQ